MKKKKIVLLLTMASLLIGCNNTAQTAPSQTSNVESTAEESSTMEEETEVEGEVEEETEKGKENSDSEVKPTGSNTTNPVILKPTDQELAPRRTVYPDTVEYTAEVDGVERSWEVYVPASYDGSEEVSLVLAVHGAFLSEDMADTIKIILGIEKAPEISLDFQYQIRDQILDLVAKGITNK